MRKKISGTEIYCKYRTRKDIALYWTPIITAWITKTINFKFDEPFSVDYGNSRSEDNSKEIILQRKVNKQLIDKLDKEKDLIFTISQKLYTGGAKLLLQKTSRKYHQLQVSS